LTQNVSTITSQNERSLGLQPFALWLTGLPASGKTTLGSLLVEEIKRRGYPIQLLDSDELREVLTPEPSYSAAERDWFYSTLIYIGRLLTQNDVSVIFSATAHMRVYRDWARATFEKFSEIYLKCSLNACIERDKKGTYQKALAGEAQSVPGVQVLYEAPKAAGITVDTQRNSPQECVETILEKLESFNYIQAAG
jgi:adenylylsulfate kinase